MCNQRVLYRVEVLLGIECNLGANTKFNHKFFIIERNNLHVIKVWHAFEHKLLDFAFHAVKFRPDMILEKYYFGEMRVRL